MHPPTNSQSTGVHNPEESTPSLSASQILPQLNQMYVMLQAMYPGWSQHSFRSLVDGRSDAQLGELHVNWAQYLEYGQAQLCAAVSMA